MLQRTAVKTNFRVLLKAHICPCGLVKLLALARSEVVRQFALQIFSQ